jgi:hypothetical protein
VILFSNSDMKQKFLTFLACESTLCITKMLAREVKTKELANLALLTSLDNIDKIYLYLFITCDRVVV